MRRTLLLSKSYTKNYLSISLQLLSRSCWQKKKTFWCMYYLPLLSFPPATLWPVSATYTMPSYKVSRSAGLLSKYVCKGIAPSFSSPGKKYNPLRYTKKKNICACTSYKTKRKHFIVYFYSLH
uniref:PB125R n=1 Tax=African swine fever virus TaxID=10497 RepID=A0A6G7KTQ1_ASF